MNYWQIAAGAGQRDYSEYFFRFGLAFVGGKQQIARMGTVKVGDRILLKRGIDTILAAGEVVERDGRHSGHASRHDKEWLLSLRGWYLPAWCCVRWHVLSEPLRVARLARGAIQQIHLPHLKKLADDIISTVPARRSIDIEPPPARDVEPEEIEALFQRLGDGPGSSRNLATSFARVCAKVRLYWGDEDSADFDRWAEIREHEARTFLVIPLLLALGWREEQLKIERPVAVNGKGKRIDIACFLKPFARKADSPELIVETKGLNVGLDFAPGQAREYATPFPDCKTVVATNGRCYLAYSRDDNGDLPEEPTAYVDLMHLKHRDPLDPQNIDGCLKTLELLMPPSCIPPVDEKDSKPSNNPQPPGRHIPLDDDSGFSPKQRAYCEHGRPQPGDLIAGKLLEGEDLASSFRYFQNLFKDMPYPMGLHTDLVDRWNGGGRAQYYAAISKDRWKSPTEAGEPGVHIHFEARVDALKSSFALCLHHEPRTSAPRSQQLREFGEAKMAEYEAGRQRFIEYLKAERPPGMKFGGGVLQVARMPIELNERTRLEDFSRDIYSAMADVAKIIDAYPGLPQRTSSS